MFVFVSPVSFLEYGTCCYAETEQRWYQSPKLRVLGMACGVVLGTSYVLNERSSPLWSDEAAQNSCMGVKWVQDLAEVHGNELVLSAATLHSHPLLKKDHMVDPLPYIQKNLDCDLSKILIFKQS